MKEKNEKKKIMKSVPSQIFEYEGRNLDLDLGFEGGGRGDGEGSAGGEGVDERMKKE